MKTGTLLRNTRFLALAAMGLVVSTGANAAPQADEIIVQETRSGVHARRSALGASQKMISVTRRVDIRDLDLRTYSGAMQLEARINQTAVSLCERLRRMQGFTSDERRTCIRDAVADAMEQVRAAVWAAEDKARKASLTSSR